MNSRLRKAHKYIWLILTVIIPVIIFYSVKDVTLFHQNVGLTPVFNSANDIVKTSENKILKASLIKKDSSFYLEVLLKKPLKQPSLLLEHVNSNGAKEVLGQLSSAGTYKFKVDASIKAILLRDPLKNEDTNVLTILSL